MSDEVDDSVELTELLEQSVEMSSDDFPNSTFSRIQDKVVAPPTPPGEDTPQTMTGKHEQWSTADDRVYRPIHRTRQKLPPGYYEVCHNNTIGLYFQRKTVCTESLMRFPDSVSLKVVQEIETFWMKEPLYRQFGLAYKRGILLFGPPGGGKTCTVQLLCEDVIGRGGIVIEFSNPALVKLGVDILREIQPDVPIVLMMEDIDAILETFNESDVLNILDGVNKIDRAVYVATTNYPERLGARIVNRPSRFDKRHKIPMPSEIARRMYLEHLLELGAPNEINVDAWVADMDGLSLAHLKELFVAVAILGMDYETTVKVLQSMREKVTSDQDYVTTAVGFAARQARGHGGTGWFKIDPGKDPNGA